MIHGSGEINERPRAPADGAGRRSLVKFDGKRVLIGRVEQARGDGECICRRIERGGVNDGKATNRRRQVLVGYFDP